MDENKITVAVCGDSFCTASTVDLKEVGVRAHFSQMLEDQYGYQVIHLAHGGFSNTGIFFQMQKALELGADVVVYNRTWASRINLSMHDNFEPSQGLKNFIYSNPHMPSTGSLHVGDSNAAILSTVWQNLENSTFFDLTKEQLVAVDLYMKYFMNYNFQDTIDGWLFEFWHNKILDAGVLPVFFNNDNVGKVAYDFSGNNPNVDTPFHTDRATQQTVANNIHQIIHGQNIQRHQ